MSLKREILRWNGKSVDELREIYTRHHDTARLFSRIITLIAHPSTQKGATKLLKLHLQSGQKLKPSEVVKLCQQLRLLKHWQSRLHALQCLSSIPIPIAEKSRVEAFLRTCLIEDTKFVRAWAYSGFYELASQYPEYRKEVEQFFRLALKDEVGSVQARIRNVLKKGF